MSRADAAVVKAAAPPAPGRVRHATLGFAVVVLAICAFCAGW